MDHYADDLAALTAHLDLKNTIHVGHSTGGGEVVHYLARQRPVIGDQVILSSPGGPCMRCMGFLTEEKLAQEAARYGNAGRRPQVVWPNGVLASTAVGLAVDLVTGWTQLRRSHAYLVYDGNEGTLKESVTLRKLKADCPHFSVTELGDPVMVDL